MYSGKLNTDKRIVKLAVAGIIFLLLLISFLFDPVNYKITDCAFRDVTGLSCPGCGLSRSFHSTVHFNLTEAFGFHLLGPLFFLILLSITVKYSYEGISGNYLKKVISKGTGSKLVVVIFLLWLLYWIIRITMEIM